MPKLTKRAICYLQTDGRTFEKIVDNVFTYFPIHLLVNVFSLLNSLTLEKKTLSIHDKYKAR